MAKTIALADQQSTPIERMKSQPQRLIDFLKDVRAEIQSTTAIVIVTVFIFAAYFALVDYVVGQGVTQLIQHFTTH